MEKEMNITISIPDEIAKDYLGENLEQQMTLSFVIDQYRQGHLTLRQARDWAQLGETEFLTQCQLRGVSRQTYASEADLLDELTRLQNNFPTPQL
jgi:predicted HTH domain antitoxin